jgi:hypothetical protein
MSILWKTRTCYRKLYLNLAERKRKIYQMIWAKRRNPEINWSELSIKLDRNYEKARVINLFGTREKLNKEISKEEHLQ